MYDRIKLVSRQTEKGVIMYTFNSRVRYSETDESGHLSVIGMINYMQDCSTFQSEDAQVGVGHLEKKHKAWLLSSWQIMIDRYPGLGEGIVVGTWPYSFKGIYGYRNFVIRDESGNDVVRAESVWFLYDTEKNLPLRVQPEDAAPYGLPEPRLILSPASRKIPVPEIYEVGKSILITRHHIDTNHHVNNAQYVDIARESIPTGLKIREIRADYKRAALLGDQIIPHISREKQGEKQVWTVALSGGTGELYAVVWIQTEAQ